MIFIIYNSESTVYFVEANISIDLMKRIADIAYFKVIAQTENIDWLAKSNGYGYKKLELHKFINYYWFYSCYPDCKIVNTDILNELPNDTFEAFVESIEKQSRAYRAGNRFEIMTIKLREAIWVIYNLQRKATKDDFRY